MNINVEVVDEKIETLSVQVTDSKLVAYIPNKTFVSEVIWLIAALVGSSSVQELQAINSGWSIKVTCDAIDMPKVSEVVIKVESQSDFVRDSVIDMSKSTFSFEPQW
jgi:hypothetical protein